MSGSPCRVHTLPDEMPHAMDGPEGKGSLGRQSLSAPRPAPSPHGPDTPPGVLLGAAGSTHPRRRESRSPQDPPGPESLRTGAPAPPTRGGQRSGGRGAHPQQLPVAADEDADVVLAVPPLGQGQVAAIPGKGDSCQEEDRAGIKSPDRRRTRVLSKEEGGAAQADTATRGRVRCGLAPTGAHLPGPVKTRQLPEDPQWLHTQPRTVLVSGHRPQGSVVGTSLSLCFSCYFCT